MNVVGPPMSIVESLLFAGAIDVLSQRHIKNVLDVTPEEGAAIRIVHEGMTREGYSYRPGILEPAVGLYFYEAMSAVEFIRELAASRWP